MERAYKITVDEFRKENDISAVFACWDPGINTVSHALVKLGLDKKSLLVGFDGLPRTLENISSGLVTATVSQDTDEMGRRSVELIKALLEGQAPESRSLIAPRIIDSKSIWG